MKSDDKDPDLSSPWSIGESGFAAIVQELEALAPKSIVEFGSGNSTIRLAKAFPDATILSIESDAGYRLATAKLVEKHGLASTRVRVEHRPLAFQRHALGIYQSYSVGAFPAVVDAVLIDGPPHWTKRGREACLYQVMPCLRVGGRVFLDDYERAGEQRIVRNWSAAYPNVFAVHTVEAGHRLCVLEKQQQGSAPQTSLSVVWDAFQTITARVWEIRRGDSRHVEPSGHSRTT